MLQHVRQQFSSSVIFLYTSSNESMLFLVLLHKFVTHKQPSSASFSGPGNNSILAGIAFEYIYWFL